MAKRERQRAGRRRGRAEQQKRQRKAEARANLVYDPATAPDRAAAFLYEAFGHTPVQIGVAPTIATRGGVERARAVADAALHLHLIPGPMALSLAADVALLEDRTADAEAHVTQALALSDDPDLHLRLAAIRASQGRLAVAIDDLWAQLSADPGLHGLQLACGDLLEELQERADAPPADQHVLDRFRDRSTLVELKAAVARFVNSTEERGEAFAAGVLEWVEAGAVTEDELEVSAAPGDATAREAGRKGLIGEWAWLMPLLDGPQALLAAFADETAVPTAARRRAADWLDRAMWGLWEVGRPAALPGAVLTELLTGQRLYVEVPPALLAGVARWSVLLGYVLPVDGVWRMGGWFEVASPIEARELAHELIDEVLAHARDLGGEGREMVAWARRAHDEIGDLWLPGAVEPPSPVAWAMLQALVRTAAPHLVAGLRRMQGTAPPDTEPLWASLTLADPDAAWEALAGRAEFELDDGELFWFEPPADAETGDEDRWVRATLSLEDDEIVVEPQSADDLSELLLLLDALGHPALAVDERVADEPPEPPVTLPDLPAGEIAAWLSAWHDEPVEALDGLSPREALRRHHAEAEVEMLIRYLEHEADTRGLSGLDTGALRTELGLQKK